jgi:ribonuclease HII
MPNFNQEKKLWKQGYKYVAGLDEAGRGPLAGPVVAAAVMLNPKHEIRNPKQIQKVSNFEIRISDLEIRDSKQITEKQREYIYGKIIRCKDIEWGIGIVSEKIIDKINILQATKLAMQKAVKNLVSSNSHDRRNLTTLDFLLVDGNFKIKSDIPQKSVVGGDEKIFSCAAASIVAKVTRDRIMQKMHKKYPQYGFDKHKGYPTKAHFANLEKFGPCKIHRKTFWPCRKKLSTGLAVCLKL